MKVIFFTSTLTSGGAERVISLLANEFNKKGHEIEVIALTSISPDFYVVDEGVKFIHADKACHGSLLKEMFWVRKHVREVHPDIVIAFMEAVYEFVLLALQGTGIPVITSERKDPSTLGPLRKILRWILLPTSTCCAHVVQTHQIKSYYNKTVQRKTHIIYNPVNERVFDENVQNLTLHRKKRIISVGRLYPQKNQEMLIKAFSALSAKYKDWNLVIYGEGFLRSQLEKLIGELSMRDSIFLPGVSHNVIEEIAQSEIFAMSSNYEGMSNAMIEAMCVGTPVVSTRVSGTDELIRDGENGLLVDVGDEKKMIAALDRLMGDVRLRKKFSNAYVAQRDCFKTENIIEKWLKLCNTFIKDNSNPDKKL